MAMYSNILSAVKWRKNRSTFNALEERVMSVTKVVRRKALRVALILVTFTPMLMLYNASRADESIATQRVSRKDLILNSPEGAELRLKAAAPPRHSVTRAGRG